MKYYPSLRGVLQISLLVSLPQMGQWSDGAWLLHADSDLSLPFLLSGLITEVARNFLVHLRDTCLENAAWSWDKNTFWHFSIDTVSIVFLLGNYYNISKDLAAKFALLLLPLAQGLFCYLCCHSVCGSQLWSSSHCVRHHSNGLYVTALATKAVQFSMGRQKGVAEVTETCCGLCKVIQWVAGRSKDRTIVSKSQYPCKTTDMFLFKERLSLNRKKTFF